MIVNDAVSATTDLRKLRHALVLAKEGSFARASAKLYITQSALTRSIQVLERDTGVRLFDRSHVRIMATPAGKMILERAQVLLTQANNLARDIELIKDAKLGNLSFGSSPIPGAIFLPAALVEIYREYPRLEIRVESKGSVELLALLLEEKLEFFIGDARQFQDRPDISIQPLAKIPVHFFVREGHPLAAFEHVALKQLTSFPLGSSRFFANRLEVLGQIYGAHASELSGHFICDDIDTLKTMVLNTDIVLLTGNQLVQEEVERQQLKRLSLPEVAREMMTHTSIVKLAGRSLSPTAKLLIDNVRLIVRQQTLSE